MIAAQEHLEASPETSISDNSQVLGWIRGKKAGPTVVVIAGMHGNEPSGVEGLSTVIQAIIQSKTEISGDFVGLIGNATALACQARFIDQDLNRLWRYEQENLLLHPCNGCAEEKEFSRINKTLEEILANRRGEVIFLDLHTTSADSAPFILIGDTLRNRDFVQDLGVPVILGLEETLNGPLLSYINELGHISFGFEAGQHFDPISVQNHIHLLWLILSRAGTISLSPEHFLVHKNALSEQCMGIQQFFELRYRHEVQPSDAFVMLPGYANMQPVEKGEKLADSKNGPILCPESGRIFMPLYQAQGNDGFFLVRRIPRFWMAASRFLRKMRLEKLLPILPGVSKHPTIANAFKVNPKVAIIAPKQILHLLGFRKMKPEGKLLVFVRRPFDQKAPPLDHGNQFTISGHSR